MTLYPNQIDGVDSIRSNSEGTPGPATILNIITALIAVEKELGIKPRGIYSSVSSRLSILESRLVSGGSSGGGGVIDLGNQVSGILDGSFVNTVFNFPVQASSFVIGPSGAPGPSITVGTGVPTAIMQKGSIYLRSDGGATGALYTYQGTGWSVIAGAAGQTGIAGPQGSPGVTGATGPRGATGIAIAGGTNGQMQFNNAGAIAGATGLIWSTAANRLSVGTGPATAGSIALSNNTGIYSRNAGGTGNYSLIQTTNTDVIYVGSSPTGSPNLVMITPDAGTISLVGPSLTRLSLGPSGAQFNYPVNVATGGISFTTGSVPSGGYFNIPYSSATVTPIIKGMGSTSVGMNILGYGSGDAIVLGNDSQNLSLVGFASSTISMVGSGIQMSGGGGSFNIQASLNTTSNPLAFGTSPSSSGTIRVPNVASFKSRNVGNTADLTVFETTASNTLEIGTDSGYTAANQFSRIDMYASPGGAIYIGTGSNTRLGLNSAGVTVYTPGDPLTFGYNAATTTGLIRFPGTAAGASTNFIVGYDATASANRIIVNASDTVLNLGSDNAFSNNYATINLNSNGTVALNVGSGGGAATFAQVTSSGFATYGNTAIGAPTSGAGFGAGVGVLYLADASTIPTTNPSLGALVYSKSNTLQYRAPDGQISVLDSFDNATNGFRLTVSSGNPVPLVDVVGNTLYLTPFTSGNISLYDGSNWRMVNSSGAQITISGLSVSLNYDVFVYRTAANTMALEILAWSSLTTRATAIVRQNGVQVKSGDATRRYVGTFHPFASAQIRDYAFSRYVYNEYNQVSRTMYYLPSAAWTYTSGVIQQAGNGNTNFRLDLVVGNPTQIDVVVYAPWTNSGAYSAGMVYYPQIGLGNTTNVAQVQSPQLGLSGWVANPTAQYQTVQSAGYQSYWWLESGSTQGISVYAGTPAALANSIMKLYVTM